MTAVLMQISLLDLVFSFDLVITAVGMVDENQLWVMVAAVVVSIGMMLIAEGAGTHINKGYIYFAMAFALIVEVLNIRMCNAKRKREAATHWGAWWDGGCCCGRSAIV